MKAFKDESIFENVKEFKNENGKLYRALNRGCGFWSVYKAQDNAFVHDAVVKVKSKASCKAIYEAYMNCI